MDRLAFSAKDMRPCPCKGCADRYLGCHGECNKYKNWTANKDDKVAKLEDRMYKEYLYGLSPKRKRY